MNSMIPFSVLGPTRGNRQADLWEAMMNVNGGNRIRSLRYLSGINIIIKEGLILLLLIIHKN